MSCSDVDLAVEWECFGGRVPCFGFTFASIEHIRGPFGDLGHMQPSPPREISLDTPQP